MIFGFGQKSEAQRTFDGLHKLALKSLQRSFSEMTDGEIISINPDPLGTKETGVVVDEEKQIN